MEVGDSRKRELSNTDTDTSFSDSPTASATEKKEKKDNKKQKMEEEKEKVDLSMILKSLNDLNRKHDNLQKALENVATKDGIKNLRSDMDNMNKSLSHKIEVLEKDAYDLKRDRDSLTNQIDALKNTKEELEVKMHSQRQKLTSTEQSLNDLQQYTRSWSLRFFGFSEPRDGERETAYDCIDKIVTLVKKELNVDIGPDDIEVAHRTGRNPNRSERDGTAPEGAEGPRAEGGARAGPGPGGARGARPRPRPIIVRFYSRLVRDSVLIKRKLLKGKGVSIGEDLTPENFKCLKRVQEHSGTLSSWSHRGKIFAKLKNGVVLQVTATSDINQLFATGLQGRGRWN